MIIITILSQITFWH